jgi:tricorn protease
MCEANYSNAHGTPWMYKNRKIGKLVGMPVAGTMTSVNYINMQDKSLRYGIPIVGYRDEQGNYLENQLLLPDVEVDNDKAEVVKGVDSQLETAVKTLLNDIDKK